MKRTLILLSIIICLALAACAGGGEVPVAAVPTAVPTATPTATPNAVPTATPAATATVVPPTPTPTPEQDDSGEPVVTGPATGEVVISFEYVRQSGAASNQHAVWIEDMEGNLVKSLFASRWTATGGFRTRPDSIALWAERADLANMPRSDVNAVAGATPRTGSQSYTWDLTDLNGDTVLQGEYMFFVEGTLRWRNFVLYSGVIILGDDSVTVQADAEFHYEGTSRYAALTADSVENHMIGPVTVTFTP